jgi:Xaa-Pro aminopeptidase
MIPLPLEESRNRIRILQNHLNEVGLDAACIMHNVDRFYYAGSMQDGVLLVPAADDPVLFVRRTLSRARDESPLENVVSFQRFRHMREYLEDCVIRHGSIGMDLDVVPAKLYLGFQRTFPESSVVDISGFVRRQRAVKSSFELSIMEEAGKRFDRVLARMREEIRAGMSEYQVYMRFAALLLEQRSSLLIRTRMFNMEAETRYILSGSSAANLSSIDSPTAAGSGVTHAFPWGSGERRIKTGEPVLIDSIFVHEGYHVDCTRIFALGSLESDYTRAHDLSRRCHDLFRSELRPGTYIPEFYRRVFDFVDEAGSADVFMGDVKFIGHGVGLELDEFPILSVGFDDGIEEGMVIAFEPKFLFPGGTVGFENTYRVRDDGVESLNRVDEGIQYL